MLTILGAAAEMKRKLILERYREGIAKPKRYVTKVSRSILYPPLQIAASFKQ
jgi:DNA invertase Pin-like site-specific DNA recombinase